MQVRTLQTNMVNFSKPSHASRHETTFMRYEEIMKKTAVALFGLMILSTSIASASVSTMCGDANGDSKVNVPDIVYFINYVFKGGPAPSCGEGLTPKDCGDPNNDNKINVGDAVFLMGYIFKGGMRPPCTIGSPALTTTSVSVITQTTAISGGTITFAGHDPNIARGVCWSTNPTPTIADSKTDEGPGGLSFTSTLTGLSGQTPYYFRAYATNSAGTGYGAVLSFTTLDSTGTVTDIDGNTYRTAKIGNQWWMVENLKVTHYRNGDALPNVTDDITWAGLTTGAYSEYNNNPANVATYGRLYNWYAVDDSRSIAPEGWHIASDAEWQTLDTFLGGDAAAGGKMKEKGTTHWLSPNTGATDEVGFAGLPAGDHGYAGGYESIGSFALFWSSTAGTGLGAKFWSLHYYDSILSNFTNDKHAGLSVRCIKD
jgi:uncharacterized protein (TIGR02145 family)